MNAHMYSMLSKPKQQEKRRRSQEVYRRHRRAIEAVHRRLQAKTQGRAELSSESNVNTEKNACMPSLEPPQRGNVETEFYGLT